MTNNSTSKNTSVLKKSSKIQNREHMLSTKYITK